MLIHKIIAYLFSTLLIAGTVSFAQDDKPKFYGYEYYSDQHILYQRSLGFGFSGGLNLVNDNKDVGYLGSAHLSILLPVGSYVITPGLIGVYQYGELINSENFDFMEETGEVKRNYTQILGGITFQLHPSFHDFSIALNFLAGRFEFKALSQDESIEPLPKLVQFEETQSKQHEIIIYPSLEFKIWLSRGSSFDFKFGGIFPVKKEVLKDPVYDARLGFSFYLVEDYDEDNDGIPSKIDKCYNTPLGEISNEEGCSISQLDYDGDGIMNDKDECPYTPAGVKVDYKGCPIDTDKDSVPDYLDVCPGTPRNMKVDSFGCPLDEDLDGVPDHIDQCKGTPIGEIVNKDGCSSSQLDTDFDGIPDSLDVCSEDEETHNFFDDEDGCPDKTEYPDRYWFDPPVAVFETDSIALTKDVKGSLIIELVSLYEDYPNTSWVVGVNSSRNAEEKAKLIKQFIDSETGDPNRTKIEYNSSSDENIYLNIDEQKARSEAREKLGLSN